MGVGVSRMLVVTIGVCVFIGVPVPTAAFGVLSGVVSTVSSSLASPATSLRGPT